MEHCKHENCSRENRLWLPDGFNSKTDIALHPWCIHCGQIKNLSDDKGKKIGYWINELSRFNYHLPMTQVQNRLIIKSLLEHESFTDLYAVTHSAQKDALISVIHKYTHYPKKTIYNLFE